MTLRSTHDTRSKVPLNVLLADDHRLVREAVRHLLEASTEIVVVHQCDDGRAALAAIHLHVPQVAVLDVSMPKMGGLAVARSLQSCNAATRVVLLTMHADGQLVATARGLGVLGVVLKDDAPADLIHAIRSAAEGRPFISAALSCGPAESPLTPRETEVLQCVARGLTTKQTGVALGVSPRTIETHRARLMRKLSAHSTADLVRYAIRTGLVEA